MYATSARFGEALFSSNQRVAVSVTDSEGTELQVAGGSVSMDSTREVGRTATLELIPTPELDSDALYNLIRTPGLELTIKRGLIINGETELVPLGVFSTDQAEQSKSLSATVKWSGSDRSKIISRNRWIDPYAIAAGTSLATAATDLLKSRWSSVQVDFSNVSETIGAGIVLDAGSSSDPWKDARQLFADFGFDLRFDGLGVARAIVIPDPASQNPVFDFGSGETNMVLDGTARTSFDGVYNGVIASGEGTDVVAPVRAVVWDEDPTSPTYYLSGFGQVPYFFSSPLLLTEDQCRTAAQTILSRVKGRSQKLAWPAIVNPALEPLDIVSVDFWGTTSTFVLDQLSIPLNASGTMSASARETSIV